MLCSILASKINFCFIHALKNLFVNLLIYYTYETTALNLRSTKISNYYLCNTERLTFHVGVELSHGLSDLTDCSINSSLSTFITSQSYYITRKLFYKKSIIQPNYSGGHAKQATHNSLPTIYVNRAINLLKPIGIWKRGTIALKNSPEFTIRQIRHHTLGRTFNHTLIRQVRRRTLKHTFNHTLMHAVKQNADMQVNKRLDTRSCTCFKQINRNEFG
jgi:hypothetical protein